MFQLYAFVANNIINSLHNSLIYICAQNGLGGNPEFARRKVGFSSDESLTLLGGKSDALKRDKNRVFQAAKPNSEISLFLQRTTGLQDLL